jgi:23S rRNA pseudouridine1911/1915/1917 synthase
MPEQLQLNATIPEDMAGKRLDQVLAVLFSEHSRTRLQEWIKNGQVRVNNKIMRQRDKVLGGESVEIITSFAIRDSFEAEEIELQIVYEDETFLILNKPVGLVVHPGSGNQEHTLLNALLYYDPQLRIVPRAGIVQRLDKDTSGLMVIARTPETQTYLVAQMQKRKIRREYQAIVSGVMIAGGTIDKPIGRHPKQRTRMAVVDNGKPAISHYRIITKYPAHTHIRVQLETGRTHQIRVHMAYIHYPIVGDPVYGGRPQIPKGAASELVTTIQSFPRQALHASAIELQHPTTGEILHFETPLPDDIQTLINVLTTDANKNR